jgi:signal transduction histidine kinase
MLSDHGRPYRVMGTLLDITELRSLQKKYHQQELRNKSALMRGIINAQENERNRWAIELHDNIGQLLAVTNLYLANFSENRLPDREMLDRTKDIVQLSLTEIRQLSARLKTPVFQDQTLEKAIINLAENIKRAKDISFTIQISVDEAILNEEHKLMIYRIIQEQTSNIIKYAEANTVLISVTGKGQQVKILICDDGKGFDTTKEAPGIGLKNIQSRLQAYKGKMNVCSSINEGCSLSAEFLV